MAKNDDNIFGGFPFLDHTLIPNRFILKDMFDLTAWEIRALMFFFYNLYSAVPSRFIDEATIIERFGSATSDLSDTQKATPNIIRVSLASLVKNGYLNVSKKTSQDGKEVLFYSLKLDLRRKVTAPQTAEAAVKPVQAVKEEKPLPSQQSARIEILEENDLGKGSPFAVPEEKEAARSVSLPPINLTPPPAVIDTGKPKPSPAITNDSLNSTDLSDLLLDDSSDDEVQSSSPVLETDLEVDLNVSQPIREMPIAARNISKDFLSDLENVINDLNDQKKETTPAEPPAAPAKPKTDSFVIPIQPPQETPAPEPPKERLISTDDILLAEPEKPKEIHAEAPKTETPAPPAKASKFSSPEEQRGSELWDQVLKEMHVLIDNMTYNTWLKPSEYYKFQDGVHLIKVEHVKFYDKFVKQWGNLMQEVIMLIDPEFKFEFYSE